MQPSVLCTHPGAAALTHRAQPSVLCTYPGAAHHRLCANPASMTPDATGSPYLGPSWAGPAAGSVPWTLIIVSRHLLRIHWQSLLSMSSPLQAHVCSMSRQTCTCPTGQLVLTQQGMTRHNYHRQSRIASVTQPEGA